jgi:prepilin-type N-terminal cleavage/methylation domain-containing protein
LNNRDAQFGYPSRFVRVRRRNIHRRQAGFTLLEVIVATGILALLGLLIGMSVNTFHRSYMQAQKVGNELQRNQVIDRLVDSYFVNAVPFEWDDENLETHYVFSGLPDELYLTSIRRTYAKDASAIWFIRLYCEDNTLKCDYSPFPLLPWLDLDDQNFTTEVIAPGVNAISFLYAEKKDDEIEWLEEWVEEDHNGIPLAIQITIEWADGSKERWLRRTAGSSSNSTFGDREEPTE